MPKSQQADTLLLPGIKMLKAENVFARNQLATAKPKDESFMRREMENPAHVHRR